jgi:DNA-binding MarR family transcriptional regulator
VRVALDEALEPTGLTTSQVAVLSTLWSEPQLSNADLARVSFVTPQSMVPLLSSLEARKLIVRRPHASGGRALPAELTAQGKQQLKLGWAAVKKVEDRMLADMAAEDQLRLRELLEHCLASLRPEHRGRHRSKPPQ